jgi:hypothetical protein
VLFDHLVGGRKQRRRRVETMRLASPEIGVGRQEDGQIVFQKSLLGSPTAESFIIRSAIATDRDGMGHKFCRLPAPNF